MYTRKRFFIAVVAFVFVAFSCEKVSNDKIPPTLILKGNNPDTVLLGCDYQEPGYVLRDDNSVPDVYIDNQLGFDSIGTYYVRYTAIDADSNRAYATRKVVVVPKSVDNFLGVFTVYDTLAPLGEVRDPYQVEARLVGQSESLIEILNFNNYGDDFRVTFTYDSTSFFNIDYNKTDTVISGNGSAYCNSRGFRIVYTVNIPDQDQEFHRTTFRK